MSRELCDCEFLYMLTFIFILELIGFFYSLHNPSRSFPSCEERRFTLIHWTVKDKCCRVGFFIFSIQLCLLRFLLKLKSVSLERSALKEVLPCEGPKVKRFTTNFRIEIGLIIQKSLIEYFVFAVKFLKKDW